jgi:hypothetical protein
MLRTVVRQAIQNKHEEVQAKSRSGFKELHAAIRMEKIIGAVYISLGCGRSA